jgi:hypothetical protein
MPRRYAWLFFVAGALLLFLAIVRLAWSVGDLPDWLEPAGLMAIAIGGACWTLPNNPNL